MEKISKESLLTAYKAVENKPTSEYNGIQYAGRALACGVDRLTIPAGWQGDETMRPLVEQYTEAEKFLSALRPAEVPNRVTNK